MTATLTLILGYFLALNSILILNKYYLKKDPFSTNKKISLSEALFLAFTNWFGVSVFILIIIFHSIENVFTINKTNITFKKA